MLYYSFRFLSLFLIGFTFLFYACDSKGGIPSNAKSTKSGIKYVIHTPDNPKARKAKAGDFMDFHILIVNHKDSVLTNTFKDRNMMIKGFPVRKDSTIKGVLEEVLFDFSEGDSATVWISIDSLMKKSPMPLPAYLAKGTYIKYQVKVVKIQTEQEKKEAEAISRTKQNQTDSLSIQKYIDKQSLSGVKSTGTGLRYVITAEGKGRKPKAGDTVSVHYVGKTLEGKEFDNSNTRGMPFDFVLGQNPPQVIIGWEEGISLLNEGSKATLLIPSSLAYGENGNGAIKPNEVLVFDVELVKIKGK
ncbi:MAG TPA: peptidylprolyl isomerase [Microscillaceae bacterium]|nr:peptidylprolyl isomerase [Microscillaceae bacterium]